MSTYKNSRNQHRMSGISSVSQDRPRISTWTNCREVAEISSSTVRHGEVTRASGSASRPGAPGRCSTFMERRSMEEISSTSKDWPELSDVSPRSTVHYRMRDRPRLSKKQPKMSNQSTACMGQPGPSTSRGRCGMAVRSPPHPKRSPTCTGQHRTPERSATSKIRHGIPNRSRGSTDRLDTSDISATSHVRHGTPDRSLAQMAWNRMPSKSPAPAHQHGMPNKSPAPADRHGMLDQTTYTDCHRMPNKSPAPADWHRMPNKSPTPADQHRMLDRTTSADCHRIPNKSPAPAGRHEMLDRTTSADCHTMPNKSPAPADRHGMPNKSPASADQHRMLDKTTSAECHRIPNKSPAPAGRHEMLERTTSADCHTMPNKSPAPADRHEMPNKSPASADCHGMPDRSSSSPDCHGMQARPSSSTNWHEVSEKSLVPADWGAMPDKSSAPADKHEVLNISSPIKQRHGMPNTFPGTANRHGIADKSSATAGRYGMSKVTVLVYDQNGKQIRPLSLTDCHEMLDSPSSPAGWHVVSARSSAPADCNEMPDPSSDLADQLEMPKASAFFYGRNGKPIRPSSPAHWHGAFDRSPATAGQTGMPHRSQAPAGQHEIPETSLISYDQNRKSFNPLASTDCSVVQDRSTACANRFGMQLRTQVSTNPHAISCIPSQGLNLMPNRLSSSADGHGMSDRSPAPADLHRISDTSSTFNEQNGMSCGSPFSGNSHGMSDMSTISKSNLLRTPSRSQAFIAQSTSPNQEVTPLHRNWKRSVCQAKYTALSDQKEVICSWDLLCRPAECHFRSTSISDDVGDMGPCCITSSTNECSEVEDQESSMTEEDVPQNTTDDVGDMGPCCITSSTNECNEVEDQESSMTEEDVPQNASEKYSEPEEWRPAKGYCSADEASVSELHISEAASADDQSQSSSTYSGSTVHGNSTLHPPHGQNAQTLTSTGINIREISSGDSTSYSSISSELSIDDDMSSVAAQINYPALRDSDSNVISSLERSSGDSGCDTSDGWITSNEEQETPSVVEKEVSSGIITSSCMVQAGPSQGAGEGVSTDIKIGIQDHHTRPPSSSVEPGLKASIGVSHGLVGHPSSQKHPQHKKEDCTQCLRGGGDEPKLWNMEMPYACSFCCKTFSKNQLFANYQDSHVLEGPFKCTECGVNSVQKIQLVPDKVLNAKSKHMRRLRKQSSDDVGIRAEDFPYICTACSQHFEQGQDFLNHLRVHDKVALNRCVWCGRSFSLEMDIIMNWTNLRGDNPSLCVECEKILNVKCSLLYNQTPPKEKKTCRCKDCSKNYHHCSKMKTPLQTTENMALQDSDEVTTTTTENSSRRNKCQSAVKPKQRYVCTKCGKSCKHKMDLIKHKRIHSWENPYICPQCGKCFGQKSSLKFHLQIHRQASPQVSSSQDVNAVSAVLTQSSHTEPVAGTLVQVMFKCDKCECAFMSKDELTQHKRLHENLFRHSLCRKKFHQNLEVTWHQDVHPEENLFGCGDCGKSFAKKVDLLRHQKLHTRPRPYLCSVCGKRFLCSQTFTIHQRIHTGEKPFTCTECGKSFTQKISLVRHQRIHTGEKPYSCPKCGKRFARKATMTSHQMLHPPEKLEIVKIQIL